MVYPFSYDIIYSRRKSIAIQITLEGCVKVRAPYSCPRSVIESFLSEKQQWITTHLEAAGKAASAPRREFSDAERRRYIELARIFLPGKQHGMPVLWRYLRTYLHPGAKNPLGKLQQQRESEL